MKISGQDSAFYTSFLAYIFPMEASFSPNSWRWNVLLNTAHNRYIYTQEKIQHLSGIMKDSFVKNQYGFFPLFLIRLFLFSIVYSFLFVR